MEFKVGDLVWIVGKKYGWPNNKKPILGRISAIPSKNSTKVILVKKSEEIMMSRCYTNQNQLIHVSRLIRVLYDVEE